MIEHCAQEKEILVSHREINQVHHCNKRTSMEFRLNVKIGYYDMENTILDLGSNVNVIYNKLGR